MNETLGEVGANACETISCADERSSTMAFAFFDKCLEALER